MSHIGRGAEIAYSKSPGFGRDTNCLGHEKGIYGCRRKRQEVVVARQGIVQTAPAAEPVKIGTESKYHGCFRDHFLIEVKRKQVLPNMLVPGNYYAVNLHITRRGCSASLFNDLIEKFSGNILIRIFPYCSPLKKSIGIEFHHNKFQIIYKVNKFSRKGLGS